MRLAAAYIQRGQYEAAMEKLNRAQEQDPKSAEAETVLGVLYETIGDRDEAGIHYRRAVQLGPEDPNALNNYGTWLCQDGRIQQAEKQFLAAADSRFYRTPEVALTNAGSCAMRDDQVVKAEQYFRRALDINAGYPDALYQLASLKYGQGDYMRARAFLQRYLEVAPADAESLLLAIRVEKALGDDDAARNYRNALMADFPDSAEARKLRDGDGKSD